MKMVKDHLLYLFVDFLLFTQNDIAFMHHCKAVKLGTLENVADNIDGGKYILMGRHCIMDSVLVRGICI